MAEILALVVDDKANWRDYISEVLGKLGFTCFKASDVLEAERLINDGETRDRPFVLVTIDDNLPLASGYDLVTFIKSHPSKQIARTHCIVVSGSVTRTDLRDYLTSGLSIDFIEKKDRHLRDKLREMTRSLLQTAPDIADSEQNPNFVPNVAVNISGGTYINATNVTVGGDVVGRDKLEDTSDSSQPSA